MIHFDSTGSTSSGNASGNLPVIHFDGEPRYKTNSEILVELEADGFADALSIEAKYMLEHTSYRHMKPYIDAVKSIQVPSGGHFLKTAHDMLTFDRRIQSVLLKYIGIIEAQMRAQYSAAMASTHGPFAIYDAALFLRPERYEKTFVAYSEEVDRASKRNRDIRLECEKFDGCLPIWAGAECMTLGVLSSFYSNTSDRSITDSVADSFGVKKDELTNWMKTVTEVRNICAHFEPLLVRRQLPSVPKRILGVQCERRSPFMAMLIVSHLLGKSVGSFDPNLNYGNRVKEELAGVIIGFEQHCNGHVPIQRFPFNWRTLFGIG